MAYPIDGEPNLRPGAHRPGHVLPARYEPTLALDELFEDFLTDGLDHQRPDRAPLPLRLRPLPGWLDETATPPVLGAITFKAICALS